MSSTHTEENLRGIIKSFKDGLELYSTTLSTSPLSQLKTQELIDADLELIKVAKLLYAHATKLGIAFRPPVSINAAYEMVRDTSEKMLLIVGVTSQFEDEKKWSKLFQKAVVDKVQNVIGCFITLLDELDALDFRAPKREKEEEDQDTGVNGRLVSVGKVWDSCTELQSLLESGKLGLLKQSFAVSIDIIDDALEEFTEWTENPEVMDDFDPFGFGGEDTSDNEGGEDEEKKNEEIDPETLELAETWTQKIKMLKLLLSSLAKSLPTSKDTDGGDIDEFHREQDVLVGQVDDLVAAFFLNSGINETKKQIKKIQKQSELLITLVRNLNEDNEQKTKWLDLWQDKFLL